LVNERSHKFYCRVIYYMYLKAFFTTTAVDIIDIMLTKDKG
jgi:hypothetical protein